jgi:adenosylhomocysteine nucleosidase
MEHELSRALAAPLIVSALPAEQKVLKRRLRARGTLSAWTTERGGRTIRGLVTGDGAARAARGLSGRLEGTTGLVIVGIGGGLSPDLATGDLVFGRRLRDADDPDFVMELARPPKADGTFVSAPEIVARAEDKTALWRRLGAPPRAIVDLESVAYARLATARGLPVIALRVVSDAADEDLPDLIPRAADAEGSVRAWRVALGAVGRPGTWRDLGRLARRLSVAAETLADATLALLDGEAATT